MTVRYRSSDERHFPIYVCQREGINNGEPVCQRIIGTAIDEAIGKLVVDTVTPRTLEMTFALQKELDARVVEADALRLKHVERAQYEVDLARRRYMRVDPDNRLVADSLEAEWNARLRALADAQEQYTREREADRVLIDQQKRTRILALAKDLPRLWNDPATPVRERKRMLRLIVEDVTLAKSNQITMHVRFRGGATQSLALPLPKCAWELRQTSEQLLRELGALLRYHGDEEVARILNSHGHRSGSGRPFSRRIVFDLRTRHGLETRFDRLREEGMLTLSEMADKLGVCTATVKTWRDAGLLRAEPFDDKGQCLYATIGDDVPRKKQGSKLSRRLPSTKLSSQSTEEV